MLHQTMMLLVAAGLAGLASAGTCADAYPCRLPNFRDIKTPAACQAKTGFCELTHDSDDCSGRVISINCCDDGFVNCLLHKF
ncbi:hypothetical protein UVI_02060960 [Ustilaginoidea virens]|uniref:Uncharacterized protein n=1 Tax=Ustilaginoidea virens TaxID=1159556 RepID=A0A1B5L1D4_USTVR|nr:hypothetical protein UVI_02060960 [Ustilaginoidea virens]